MCHLSATDGKGHIRPASLLFICLLVCLKLLTAFGKTSAIIWSIGIAQLSLRSDKSLLRCDYQEESIKIASLASMRNVGSDFKQIHGKAVNSAWFSPRIRMGSVSSFVTVFTPHPLSETWHFFFLQKGPRKLFC